MDDVTLGYVIIGVAVVLLIAIFSFIYKKKYDTGTDKKKSNETMNSESKTDTEQEEEVKYGFGILACAGIVLLIIGLATDAGSDTGFGNVVNLHKLHIKQTLYYFSGVCFIMSSISFGVEKIVKNLRGIQIYVRENTKT